MRTKIFVALDGILLTDLDDTIILQGVDEQAPSWNPTAANRGHLLGQHYITTEKRYRDVVVRFAIRSRDYTWRATVLNKVAAWASAGGALTLNYRPGMELRVECVTLPAISDISQWANPYQLTFRAYDIPQWISQSPNTATVSTASGTADINVTGTAGGKLRVSAVNSSGSACSTVTITANSQTITLSSLSLADGETLVIDYTDNDIQRIRILNASNVYRSVLSTRSTASVDDIWLTEGTNTITVSSSVSLAWTFSTYGRWA